MFDSHCHLSSNRFAADRDEAVVRMQAAGIAGCLSIGTGLEDAQAVRALAIQHPGVVYAAAGLDPFSAFEAGSAFDRHLDDLRHLLAAGGFVALGECGIEFHHEVDPVALQHERFSAQISLAVDLDLPLVVHARSGPRGGDAHAVALDLVRQNPRARGVIHSFDGNTDQARAWLSAGFLVAFNGMLSFKSNDGLRAAALSIPADRLLIETDAPYLAPVPHRGKRCEPAHAAVTAALLADLRGERVEDVMAWAGRNARMLFHI